jgi:hypothetical protein
MRFVEHANEIPADAGPDELRTRLGEYEAMAQRFGQETLVGRAAQELARQCRERLAAQERA